MCGSDDVIAGHSRSKKGVALLAYVTTISITNLARLAVMPAHSRSQNGVASLASGGHPRLKR
jgi:hypothetical protein